MINRYKKYIKEDIVMSTSIKEMRNSALYTANSIPNALELYSEALTKSGDLKNIAHAKAIMRYHDEIINKKYISRLRSNFNEIYNLIDKDYPHIRFLIEGRRKSLISTDNKICKLLDENRSLDLLRDTNGFRILIFGNNSLELINDCYSIMEDIIQHFIRKGSTLCEAEQVSQTTNFNPEDHPGLVVPEKSGISEEFLYGVKDYVLYPKENGYQSLHVVFRTTTGECFEIQIRTFDMHLYAESGKANHSAYKKKKYKDGITFDRKQISIQGYGVSDDGTLYDFIGLEKSLEILKRQKTF